MMLSSCVVSCGIGCIVVLRVADGADISRSAKCIKQWKEFTANRLTKGDYMARLIPLGKGPRVEPEEAQMWGQYACNTDNPSDHFIYLKFCRMGSTVDVLIVNTYYIDTNKFIYACRSVTNENHARPEVMPWSGDYSAASYKTDFKEVRGDIKCDLRSACNYSPWFPAHQKTTLRAVNYDKSDDGKTNIIPWK